MNVMELVMCILIVEDELKMGVYLKKGFEELGFSVDFVKDGGEGLMFV